MQREYPVPPPIGSPKFDWLNAGPFCHFQSNRFLAGSPGRLRLSLPFVVEVQLVDGSAGQVTGGTTSVMRYTVPLNPVMYTSPLLSSPNVVGFIPGTRAPKVFRFQVMPLSGVVRL